jgi:hypothetical protein
MDYLIVHYWEYLSAAAVLGLIVGWWAQGSRRGATFDDEAGP